MIQYALNLPRGLKQTVIVLFDAVAVVLVLIASFSLRLGHWYFPNQDWGLAVVILAAPILAIPIFMRFGLYRAIIRYIGYRALWAVAQAVTLYALLWGLIGFMVAVDGIPRSVVFINWILVLLVIGGIRMLARWALTKNDALRYKQRRRVVIYGAGSAGRQLSTALQLSKEYIHVAFVDDNPSKQGIYVNDIPVESSENLSDLINSNEVDEVLLALPSISRKKRGEIIENLRHLAVAVRSLPSLSALAKGEVAVSDLHEINIKDLLGRESVEADDALLKTNILNKTVLVTGAGGSIGSELCRQIIFLRPKRLILFEINELALYQIERELDAVGMHSVELLAILGSVRDGSRMRRVCDLYKVQTIYHAAAYKHVPLVEFNNSEGVLNNTIGTQTVAEVAIETGVETFVLISTDKAVRPTNTMGATKRVAELTLQALATQEHNTSFTMVRFGNVLDSSGSVIPLFKDQISTGGPVTVTDINIVRYFMTIPEAVELVIQAGAMCEGGDVFVLDMGKPVRIYDLAEKMIQLSGLQVWDENSQDGDIEIKCTGLRPGEKLYEELLVGENTIKTDNPLIMHAKEVMIDWERLRPILEQLQEAAINLDQLKIRELLILAVPDFEPQCDIVDFLFVNDE